MQQAFICHDPEYVYTPIIYSSPHSGRIYETEFLDQASLKLKEIRVSEDFYVDQLLQAVTENGGVLLEACFPRSFVDVNRSCDDLDQKLISNLKTGAMNPRTAAGLGVVPRIVGEGIEIYNRKLSIQEINLRLKTCYFPFHERLQGLINRSIDNFGEAILFDVHSMPHSCLENSADDDCLTPEIVLGDCFGLSCSPKFSQKVFDIFVSQGFIVKKNSPFSGGFITRNYGVSSHNVEAIQIEIDRSLYIDERTFELHNGFFKLKKTFQIIINLLSNIKETERYPIRAAE